MLGRDRYVDLVDRRGPAFVGRALVAVVQRGLGRRAGDDWHLGGQSSRLRKQPLRRQPLVARLADRERARDHRVGILAVSASGITWRMIRLAASRRRRRSW